jgi:hypothetical protein
MNWTITARKFLEGAVAGAAASAAAITALPGDDNYWTVLGTALVTGAIRGGLNAWKHL